jgi:hypothetical protein
MPGEYPNIVYYDNLLEFNENTPKLDNITIFDLYSNIDVNNIQSTLYSDKSSISDNDISSNSENEINNIQFTLDSDNDISSNSENEINNDNTTNILREVNIEELSNDELLNLQQKLLNIDLEQLSYDDLLLYKTLLDKLENINNTNTYTTSNESLNNINRALSIRNNQISLHESNNSAESSIDQSNITLLESNIFFQSTIDPTLIPLPSSNITV